MILYDVVPLLNIQIALGSFISHGLSVNQVL